MGRVLIRPVPMAAMALAVLLGMDVVKWMPRLDEVLSSFAAPSADHGLGSSIAHFVAGSHGSDVPLGTIVTGATDTPSTGEAEKPAMVAKDAAPKEAIPSLPEVEDMDRTVLERLQERRAKLDQRDKEQNDREALLAAAEKQLEARMAELKALDETAKADMAKKEADALTLKPLIVMYEAMKPKDAAHIFEKLDLKAVLPIASGMNPKKFSEVLAQMDPVIAGKLTLGLQSLANPAAGQGANKGDLPELADLSAPKTR